MFKRRPSRRPSSRPPREPRSNEPNPARLSKFLALVLRHRAAQFGLTPNDEGFVPLEGLLNVIHEQDGLDWVQAEDIQRVAGNHVRKRFEVRDDLVRATYGHSFPERIRYERIDPPEELYVGMSKSQIDVARTEGIRPEGRQYVHLTDDRREAAEVGRRKDIESDVVVVRAAEASQAGIAFHKPTEGLFLSDAIPAEFLNLAPTFGRPRRKHRRR